LISDKYDGIGYTPRTTNFCYNTLASYSYNVNNGKLSTLTYGNGLSVKYLYDSLDRISETQYNIGKLGWFETVCFYRYTIDGQLAAIEDYIENTVTVFSYDSSGNLIGSYVDLNINDEKADYYGKWGWICGFLG
jgi:hypothetical protein